MFHMLSGAGYEVCGVWGEPRQVVVRLVSS